MPTEYVWLDADKEFRSKVRILNDRVFDDGCQSVPTWNYDGSSTNQATTGDSEVILHPCFICDHPLLPHAARGRSALVLCDTRDIKGKPTLSNTRFGASKIFKMAPEAKPWYGFEQEYFTTAVPLSKSGSVRCSNPGKSYCGVGQDKVYGRHIAESHMQACLDAGLTLSGINAEVAPGQWEFQIGPVEGIGAADQLIVARFLLERIAEKNDVAVMWHPKPFHNQNGSGCHTNYSTADTREDTSLRDKQTGLSVIMEQIKRLGKNHLAHMEVYGKDNEHRMTGTHETAAYDIFTTGVGDRSASVRVGNETYENGKGYYEDRRPASNCDPYMVSSLILQTTVINVDTEEKTPQDVVNSPSQVNVTFEL